MNNEMPKAVQPLVEGKINDVQPTHMMDLTHEGIYRKAKVSMMRFQLALSENKSGKIINRCARRVRLYTWKLHLLNEELKARKAA